MKNLYAIYDNRLRKFSEIMEVNKLEIAGEESHEELLRMYDYQINEVKDPFFMSKVKDLELWKIGEYNQETAQIVNEPEMICKLSIFLEKTRQGENDELRKLERSNRTDGENK